MDKAFGTGLVKITPAHDFNDFDVGKRNNLKQINVLDQFGKIGAPDWFRLGDRDLALHIHRTAQLRAGRRLTDVNRDLQRRLGLAEAPILMATDDPLRTRLRTERGWMEFQPWFVGAHAEPEVREIAFDGAEAAGPTPETLEALATAERIVIAPSNPLISIAPILAVGGVQDAFSAARARGVRVIGVSPIVAGKAIKETQYHVEHAGQWVARLGDGTEATD